MQARSNLPSGRLPKPGILEVVVGLRHRWRSVCPRGGAGRENSGLVTLLLAITILSLAGFTQGLTGFGFGLVSMALLPLVLPFKDAAAVVAALNLATCAMTLYAVRGHFSWRRGAAMVIGCGLGVPIGVFALVRLDAALLLRTLGGLMVIFAATDLGLARRLRLQVPAWAGFPAGLVGGCIGGAFNVGGPPIIAFAYSQPWAKEEIVATLQLVFGTSAVLRLLLISQQGLLHPELWPTVAWALGPMLLGIMAGSHLLVRVPRAPLRAGVSVFLLLIGIKYLILP